MSSFVTAEAEVSGLGVRRQTVPDVERYRGGSIRVSRLHEIHQLLVLINGGSTVDAEPRPLRAAHEGIELLEHRCHCLISKRGDRNPVELLVGIEGCADIT